MKNSKTKKLLSILLAVMMVVGMIPATAIPASAANSATIATEYDHLVNELVIDGEETIILTDNPNNETFLSALSFQSDINIKGSGKLTIKINVDDADEISSVTAISSEKTITISESVQIVIDIENYNTSADATGISAVSGIYIKDSASVDINIYSVNENYPCLGINTGRGEISIDGDGTKNINISCPFGGICINNYANDSSSNYNELTKNNGDITIKGTGKVTLKNENKGTGIEVAEGVYNTDGTILIAGDVQITGCTDYGIRNLSAERESSEADIIVSDAILDIHSSNNGIGSRANGIRFNNSDVTIVASINAINLKFPYYQYAYNESDYGLDITGGGKVYLKSLDYSAIVTNYDSEKSKGPVCDFDLLSNTTVEILDGAYVRDVPIGYVKLHNYTTLVVGEVNNNNYVYDSKDEKAYLTMPDLNRLQYSSTAEANCVQFFANGGSGEMEILQGVTGQYTIPECEFEAPDKNYFFKNWIVNGKEMLPGTVVDTDEMGNITAIATWTNRPYVISSTVNGVTCNNGEYVDIPYGTADKIEISVTWRFPESGNQLKEIHGYTYERRMNSDGAYYTNRGEGAINIIDNGDNTYTVTETTDVAGYINQEFGFELQIDYWASGKPTTFTHSAYAKVAEILVDEVNVTVLIPDDWNDSDLPGHMQTEGMEILTDKWFILEDGVRTEMEKNESFVANQEYVYQMVIAPKYGYERLVAPESGVYINGEPAKFISRTDNRGIIYEKNFVARAKLYPLVNKDTYFMQKGDSLQINVSAFGSDVQYLWEAITANAPEFTGGTTKSIIITSKPEDEGAYQYKCTFTDKYGETATRTITVYVADMGFRDISPLPSVEDIETGISDHGYMSYGAVVFFAHDLPQEMIDAGYTMETSVTDYMDGEIVGTGVVGKIYDPTIYGEHEIVQKIIIKDDKGDVFKEYTHTHKLNLTQRVQAKVFAYGNTIDDATIRVTQNGEYVYETSTTAVLGNHTYAFYIPVGTFEIEIQKNGYKPRIYEFTLEGDDEFTLNAEILRWGDANLDDVLDVQDYQQTINKSLSDNNKLDGSYEESVMDWCEDGYIDVLDDYYCILCINGNELFSAGSEYDTYYGLSGTTVSIPVKAEGFGLKYKWTKWSNAPVIVEGTEDDETVQIYIEEGKYNVGDKFTYTCTVKDRFFNEAKVTVDLEIQSLNNLYAVTFSSQHEGITGLPGKTHVKVGESITIPELIPQLDGYTFMYWYAGSDRLNPGDTYTPYQNTIIMPYMAKDYEITLYSGIEGELFGTHTGNYGHYYYLPEMDYMPEGYVFYGWTDVEGSTEVKYTTGYRYEIKGDADLYPVIAKASDVKLTIYANDGTDQVIYETTLAEQGGSKEFTIPADFGMPLREDYVCTGFITNPDNGYYDVKYGPGSTIGSKPEGVVLYCYWEFPNILQFEGGMEGVTGLPDSVSFESPQSYQITSWLTPYCEGYEFLYWEDEEGNQYRPEDYVVVHGITTLTAVWEKLDTEHYDIWIMGQKVSKANPVIQCGDGTARVVEDEWGYCTIILDGAQITGTEGIRTEYNSLDIEVYGENTITVSGENACGITGPNGNIQITGTGSLDVNVEGDGAVGIEGLYSIDYATVNVNAEPETSDGKAYGVSCLSGGQYRITIDNGATLNTKGTYGIYRAGQLRIGKTSSVYAEGTEYGIYDVREIVDAWAGYSSGTVVAVGDVAAMYFDSSDGFPYHTLTNSEAYYGKNTAGLNLSAWDGDSDFIDTPYATYGNKYIEIVPKACTGEHSFITYAGLEGNCEKDGLSDGEYCYNCGYVKTERELIPATGHDYHTHNGKEPTCTEQGVDGTYTQCDKCGEYQGDVTFIDATGHSWGEWILIDGTDIWYDEYGYGEREYIRYCYNCDEYERIWYSYEDPNDTGSPNDWESGGSSPGKP